MSVWNNYFGFVITFVAIFTLVPYLTSLITSWLGHLSKVTLVNNLGNNSQLVVGGLGVIIHELGHAIFAYLFGHKVTNVQLLNLNYRQSGALGSVDHRWNDRNVYQMLGNFFIGLAPYYMCSLALFLLQKFLLNAQFSITSLTQSLNVNTTLSASMIFDSVLDNLKSSFANASFGMIALYIVLTIMIASTGYDLSRNDFMTVNKGILPWVVTLLVLGSIFYVFNLRTAIISGSVYFIAFSVLFMFHAIISIVLSMGVIKILGLI
ncbi:membrane protein [Companilactobacillus nantensis]|nr:membrane protein [Companilactobacillus nantensis]